MLALIAATVVNVYALHWFLPLSIYTLKFQCGDIAFPYGEPFTLVRVEIG